MARHDDAHDVARCGDLAQPRDDGGIDSAAQSDRKSLGATDGQVLPEPLWNLSGTVAHGDLS